MQNEFITNLSKYANPEQYDETYKNYTADLEFMKKHLGENKQAIIELACGTGRLAIPLAKQGHCVYGVDIEGGMLEYAKNKANKEGVSLQLSVQDCTQLNLLIQAHLIYMTGNSFQHFLTNESQDALFRSVKKHLLPKGEFIFDTRNPILQELSKVEEWEEWMELDGESIKVMQKEEYNPLTQILACNSTYISLTKEYRDSIHLRYTYPLELKRLLHQHGFEVVNLYGSWRKEAFESASISIIVHARLK